MRFAISKFANVSLLAIASETVLHRHRDLEKMSGEKLRKIHIFYEKAK